MFDFMIPMTEKHDNAGLKPASINRLHVDFTYLLFLRSFNVSDVR